MPRAEEPADARNSGSSTDTEPEEFLRQRAKAREPEPEPELGAQAEQQAAHTDAVLPEEAEVSGARQRAATTTTNSSSRTGGTLVASWSGHDGRHLFAREDGEQETGVRPEFRVVRIVQEDAVEAVQGVTLRAQACAPQKSYIVAVPGTPAEGRDQIRDYRERDVIGRLKAVPWLEWQLLFYGMTRTEDRHTYLRLKCSCDKPCRPCLAENVEDQGSSECCAGRVCRWFFGLTFLSILMCFLATANTVGAFVNQLADDTADEGHISHFTNLWDYMDHLPQFTALPQDVKDTFGTYDKTCCSSNGAHKVASASCLIPKCLDTFASFQQWPDLLPNDPQWQTLEPANMEDDKQITVLAWDCNLQQSCPAGFTGSSTTYDSLCCEAPCDESDGTPNCAAQRATCTALEPRWTERSSAESYTCCSGRSAGPATENRWESPDIVATEVCHATLLNKTDGSHSTVKIPQMCAPDFYCSSIKDQNEKFYLDFTTAVAWLVLAVLLLFNHLLVLKIATPGGSGRRSHPLSDAIDPFTLMAVALDVPGDVTEPTPDGLVQALDRRTQLLRQSHQLDPVNTQATAGANSDLEQPLTGGSIQGERRSALNQVAGLITPIFRRNVSHVRMAQTGHQAISDAARGTCFWAWLPIIGLALWWCLMPLEQLDKMPGREYMLDPTKPFGDKYVNAFRPLMFVLLSYPSLVTTALLLRVVCAIHRQHAVAIVESIGVTFYDIDDIHEQFVTLRNGLEVTGKRWQWLLFVQFLIFLALVTIPICQFWAEFGLTRSIGGSYDWNELWMVFAQLWPLGLCIFSIMDINSVLADIPADLSRRELLTVSERTMFKSNYEDLGLGIRVFGVRLTTNRLISGVLTVVALLVFSKFKSVFGLAD